MACKYVGKVFSASEGDVPPEHIMELTKQYCIFPLYEAASCNGVIDKDNTLPHTCCLVLGHPGNWHVSTMMGCPVKWVLREPT